MPKTVFRYSEKLIPKYHDVFDDILEHRHTHYTFHGGRGSTKSSAISISIPLLIAMNPDIHACVFRKVGNTLRSSVYGQIQWGIDQAGLYPYFKFRVNPMEIEFIPTGQKIMFFGLDDPQKIKSIKLPFGYIGITFFEELDQFNGEAEIRKVLQSTMRGGDKFWDFRAFNPPISAANWVNKMVLEDRDDTLVVKSSYLDVPRDWLGDAFFDEAEYLRDNNPKAYTHEYLGEPIGDGGNVFENLRMIDMSDEMINDFEYNYMGMDFGWYPDPLVWTNSYYDPKHRDLYVFDELVVKKKTNEEVWRILTEEKGVTNSDMITADSAEPKSISDFKSYGSSIRGAEKGKGSVEYSMKWLQGLNHIYVDPKRCPYTAEELRSYEYDRTKEGEILNRYPDRGNHSIDSIRYALNGIWKRRGM